MLNNKADLIEQYILNMLAKNGGEQVELKRTALAGEVSCAPSQVSYVLSTRFTNSRGFKVESQRGLGGYIRITIVKDSDDEEDKRNAYRDILKFLDEDDASFETAKYFLNQLVKFEFITANEAELAETALSLTDELVRKNIVNPNIQKVFTIEVFKTLSTF